MDLRGDFGSVCECCRNRANAEPTRQGTLRRIYLLAHPIGIQDHPSRPFKDDLAFWCETKETVSPLHHWNAQRTFEVSDPRREGGLRDAALFGGARKMFVPCEGGNQFHVAQVSHRLSVLRTKDKAIAGWVGDGHIVIAPRLRDNRRSGILVLLSLQCLAVFVNILYVDPCGTAGCCITMMFGKKQNAVIEAESKEQRCLRVKSKFVLNLETKEVDIKRFGRRFIKTAKDRYCLFCLGHIMRPGFW